MMLGFLLLGLSTLAGARAHRLFHGAEELDGDGYPVRERGEVHAVLCAEIGIILFGLAVFSLARCLEAE